MNETKWKTSTVPRELVAKMVTVASQRKLRLLGCALCYRIWHQLTDVRSRIAIVVAERYADGGAAETELGNASDGARTASRRVRKYERDQDRFKYFGTAACFWVAGTELGNWRFGDDSYADQVVWEDVAEAAVIGGARWHDELAAFCELIRCIVGNPFRPFTFNPSWLTPTAVAIATGIYAERAFDRMPILADALEDAGCNNADILTHCRGAGLHCRGCWVVDLVLGKT